MLRLRDGAGPKPARIRIDPKTGFPVVEGGEQETKKEDVEMIAEEEEEDDEEYIRAFDLALLRSVAVC